jgi:hypothetical protein
MQPVWRRCRANVRGAARTRGPDIPFNARPSICAVAVLSVTVAPAGTGSRRPVYHGQTRQADGHHHAASTKSDVSRTKSRSSSLSGCRPDIEQLSDAWEIALSGVNSEQRDVSLTYRKRDRNLDNGLESERVTAHDLKSIIDEAGKPARLSNLTLTASQDAPSREVIIKIGPGKHTIIFVEAEAADYAWVSDTHKELLGKFRDTQKWYAPS